MPGFCKAARIDEVKTHGYVLTPGRYVGAAAQDEDDEPLTEKMGRLSAVLNQQFDESATLERQISTIMKSLSNE